MKNTPRKGFQDKNGCEKLRSKIIYRSSPSRTMRKIGILFGVVLLVNPVYLFTYSPVYMHPITTNDQYGGTLHLGYTTDIQTLDPHRISIYYEDFDSSIVAVNQIFEGLVRYKSGTAEIEPLLAESWDISDNGLVYTFHLRKNVYWRGLQVL